MKEGGRRLLQGGRQWVVLADESLRLSDVKPQLGLVAPQALDVGEHCHYLVVAQYLAESRHTALEAGHRGGFLYLPALAYHAIQEPIGMVPSVAVTVQWRGWQNAVGLGDVPVGLALAHIAMAGGAVGGEHPLP